ncbi:ABC transporter ATP-binding protein [Microlunatus soli]|uniref:ABC-2 type transport system ATP-binding protein n=1 Tax=Microlunatus soli TaxID=630515 RepID=A0A1H1VRD8_9ACTN|nr:ATP-binding cassette domain-containing protein [Microlunatus soli]SDS87255.1 ABC-2 type transport system ATP-binding protein [Microlunatus soli]
MNAVDESQAEATPVRPRHAAPAADSEQAPTDATAVPPIVVDGLTKDFGRVRAVDALSFTVAPGRVTGFLGPNGAGKSTTLRVLLGLAEPTSGRATFGGVGYRDLPMPQQRVGAVLEPAFHPGRTGRDHLAVQAATAGATPRRINELLALVGLADAADRRVGGYSLGMRQRLALATALLGEPDYLILDEPGNGLDPEGIHWLRGFLQSYAARGNVVLMSSHILNEVEATVDDVVVIGNGRLLRQSPMQDLAAERRSIRLRVQDQRTATAVLDRMRLSWQQVDDRQGGFLQVQTTDPGAVGAAIFEAGLPVLELAPQEVDLESEFFALLGGQP